MKTVKVVAAIIIHNNRIFATQRGYGDFKDGWSSLAARLNQEKHRSRHLSVRSKKNWIRRLKSEIILRR